MAIKVLRPFTIGTEDAFSFGGTGSPPTKVAAADPGDPPAHDDESSYIERANDVSGQRFKPNTGFPEKMTSISAVTIKARARQVANNPTMTLAIILGGSTSTSGSFSPSANFAEFSFETTTKPGGGAWTESDLRNSTLEMVTNVTNTGWLRVTSLWLEANYVPSVSTLQFPRLLASKMLRWSRLPFGEAEIVLPVSALDVELLDDFMMSHFAGPEPTGSGWLDKNWQRRLFRANSTTFDPHTMTVTLRGKDLRRYLVDFWDTGIAPFTVQSDQGVPDGPARIDRGVTRTFARASKAWIQESGGEVVELNNGEEKIGPTGTLLELKATNYVLNSSFKDGVASQWTTVTSGSGASANDTTDLLFESAVSAQSCKLTTGVTTGSVRVEQTTPVLSPIGADGRLSVDHKDDSSFALTWRLQRTSTSEWWNDTNRNWNVAQQSNTFPVRTTKTRDQSTLITGINGNQLVLHLSLVSSTNKTIHIYHAQIEQIDFITSRIVTQGVEIAREADDLQISNDLGRRLFQNTRGTIRFRFIPNWSVSDFQWSGNDFTRTLLEINHDANNFLIFDYLANPSTGNNRFRFRINAAGTEKSAEIDQSVTAGTVYEIAGRLTSNTNLELDAASRTMSIFLNGTKGTDAAHTADMTEATTSKMYVGGSSTKPGDAAGAVSHLEILPFVYTDQEIVDF